MSDRKSFVFSEEAAKRLENLQVVCRQSTGSQVIRLALMVLEDTIKAAHNGSIEFKDKNGKLIQTYHPLMETVPGPAQSSGAPVRILETPPDTKANGAAKQGA